MAATVPRNPTPVSGYISTSAAGEEQTISQLVMRVYHQSTDQRLVSRCLDLVDRLTQVGAYGLAKALSLHDR